MSNAYLEKFGGKKATKEQLREFCSRPGKVDETGKIIYFTEQAHKNTCDINKIIAKYDKDGLITHISKFEARFGDMKATDFKAAMDKIMAAQDSFDDLPSKIRARFDNEPEKLLAFMDDPGNRDEAIKLGLIRSIWTDATDGLGEHVKEGQNKEKSANAEEN